MFEGGGGDDRNGDRRGPRAEVRARTLMGKTVLAVLRKLSMGQVNDRGDGVGREDVGEEVNSWLKFETSWFYQRRGFAPTHGTPTANLPGAGYNIREN